LIDIGVNLTHKSFRPDAKDVIDRAIAAGVEQMIVTGANVRSSRQAVQLARANPDRLYCTAGVHPHNARECDADTTKHLRELAQQPQVVAIGECGMEEMNLPFSRTCCVWLRNVWANRRKRSRKQRQ
jgi:TatD DNase family protein